MATPKKTFLLGDGFSKTRKSIHIFLPFKSESRRPVDRVGSTQCSVFHPGTARSGASLPHFVSSKAIPTLLWSTSCSYPSECHLDPNRVRRAEPPLPTGHFVGRGMLYLYLEVGTRRLAIHVGPKPPAAICYDTPRLA